MPSARIYQFPRSARRRRPPPTGYIIRCPVPRRPGPAFPLLLAVTLIVACLYLSGAVKMARHDGLYAVLLAAVWSFYFASEALLRTRVFGPILTRAGQALLAAGVSSFFGLVYWLVLSR